MNKLLFNTFNILLSLALLSPNLYAQQAFTGNSTTPITIGTPLLTGLQVDSNKLFDLNFIIDPQNNTVNERDIEVITQYFLGTLATPEQNLWVNLSPLESDRILPEHLHRTKVGHDLLQQDFMLKQLTAALTAPNHESGKKFWDTVYERVAQKYGQTTAPAEILNKVWIVPGKAKIIQEDHLAYIYESKLKVMTEKDYALSDHYATQQQNFKSIDQSTSTAADIFTKMILPLIEQEINESNDFAPLRQIYHAQVLAVWFKDHFKQHFLNQAYTDQMVMEGIAEENIADKKRIYEEYLTSFKNGLNQSTQQVFDAETNELVERAYFTGGYGGDVDYQTVNKNPDLDRMMVAQVQQDPIINSEPTIEDPAVSNLTEDIIKKYGLTPATKLFIADFIAGSELPIFQARQINSIRTHNPELNSKVVELIEDLNRARLKYILLNDKILARMGDELQARYSLDDESRFKAMLFLLNSNSELIESIKNIESNRLDSKGNGYINPDLGLIEKALEQKHLQYQIEKLFPTILNEDGDNVGSQTIFAFFASLASYAYALYNYPIPAGEVREFNKREIQVFLSSTRPTYIKMHEPVPNDAQLTIQTLSGRIITTLTIEQIKAIQNLGGEPEADKSYYDQFFPENTPGKPRNSVAPELTIELHSKVKRIIDFFYANEKNLTIVESNSDTAMNAQTNGGVDFGMTIADLEIEKKNSTETTDNFSKGPINTFTIPGNLNGIKFKVQTILPYSQFINK